MKWNQKQSKLVKNGFKQPHVYNFIPWGSKNFLFFPFLKRILNAPIIQPGQLSHLFLFSNWTNPSLTFLQITSCNKVYYMKTMIEKVQLEENFSSFRLLYSAVSIWLAMTLKQPNLGSYLLSHQYSLVYYAGEGRYAGLTGIKLMRYIRVRVGLEPSNLKNLDPICERLPRS